MRFAFVFLFAFSTCNVFAQVPHQSTRDSIVTVRPDSTIVGARSFEPSKLERLRNEDELQYKLPPTVAETLWQRIKLWVGYIIQSIMNGVVETNWGNLLLYLGGLAILAVVIMTVLKVDAFRVFYSGADGKLTQGGGIADNIHEMNFEELLRDTLEKKEFRNSIRLTFLYALKILSDKQYLEWRPGKTNHDYLDELKKPELRTSFNELSFYFDYTWYGEFTVSESQYRRVAAIFNDMKSKVS